MSILGNINYKNLADTIVNVNSASYEAGYNAGVNDYSNALEPYIVNFKLAESWYNDDVAKNATATVTIDGSTVISITSKNYRYTYSASMVKSSTCITEQGQKVYATVIGEAGSASDTKATAKLYVNNNLVRTLTVNTVYSKISSSSDTWNILGY